MHQDSPLDCFTSCSYVVGFVESQSFYSFTNYGQQRLTSRQEQGQGVSLCQICSSKAYRKARGCPCPALASQDRVGTAPSRTFYDSSTPGGYCTTTYSPWWCAAGSSTSSCLSAPQDQPTALVQEGQPSLVPPVQQEKPPSPILGGTQSQYLPLLNQML